jgi:Na+-driven multidrug efflux pump
MGRFRRHLASPGKQLNTTRGIDIVDLSNRSRAISFWKVYGIVMAVDMLLYILIFYAGKAIPPASPDTSFPGNYGLALTWLFAHFPSVLIFYAIRALPDKLFWLLIFQDAWLAGLIHLWRRRRIRNDA